MENTEINTIDMEIPESFGPKILVIGVGGAGNNAVNRMIMDDVQGATFVAVNTDAQALKNSQADKRIVIGYKTTKGLGAGANPEIGLKAAQESEKDLENLVKGANMVFVAAGMGGGTGTGAAPIIANIAKKSGALTIGIVTKPFKFEGPLREKHALAGIKEISKNVDSLIVVPNNRLLELIGNSSLKDSFKEADNILKQCVQTVTDLITNNKALINLDFADVKNVMKDKGNVLFGLGVGSGEKKAVEAANRAVISPLLETEIVGAQEAIINVTGGESMSLLEANDAVDIVRQATKNDNINIIFGVAINDHLEDDMIVSIIATGFKNQANMATAAEQAVHNKSAIPWEDLSKNQSEYNLKNKKTTTNTTSDLMNRYKDEMARKSASNFEKNDNELVNDLPSFIDIE